MVISMPKQITKSEFKAKALEYLRKVEATGQSLVVTDHGRPTIEVKPFVARERHPLDILRGSVLRYERPTEPVAEDDWDAAR